jgi:hypothetical protein
MKSRIIVRLGVFIFVLASITLLSACEILELEIQPDGSLLNVRGTKTAEAKAAIEETQGSSDVLTTQIPALPTKAPQLPTVTVTLPTKTPRLPTAMPPTETLEPSEPNEIVPANTVVGPPQRQDSEFRQAANYGLAFDGVDDKVVANNLSDSIDVISNQITLEVWIYVEGVDNFVARILDHSDNQLDDRYVIGIYKDDGFPLIHLNINRNSLYSAPIALNTWIHIAGTYDGQMMRLYLNGEIQGEKVVQTFISLTESNLVIGHGGPNSQYDGAFYGILDEIVIWKIARNQEEILMDAQGFITGEEQDLVAYWKLEPGFEQILEDSAGNLRAQMGSTSEDEMDDPTWVIVVE